MARTTDEVIIDVTVDTKDAEGSLGALEDRLERLTEERKSIPIGTEEFNRLSQEIQGIEAQIKNVDLRFEALDFEQKLTAGMDAVTGLAGGFVAAQGAMLLFGAESAELEKTLAKVGGALALTQGLRDLANGVIALRKFSAVQKAAAIVTKLWTAAQTALNAAMLANPIGVIVVAVVALTGAIVALVSWIGKAEKASNEWNTSSMMGIEGQRAAVERLIETQKRQIAETKLATTTATAAQDKEIAALENRLKLAEANKEADEEIGKIREELADKQKKRLDTEIKALEDDVFDLEMIKARQIQARRLEDDLDKRAEKRAAIQQARQDIADKKAEINEKRREKEAIDTELQIALTKKQQETDKAASEASKKRAEEREQARQKSLQAQEADVNAFYQAVEEAETAHFDSFLTEQQKEINAVTDKFFQLITLAEQYGEDTKLLEDAREKALADIRKKYRDEEAQILEQLKMESFAEEEELSEIIRQANQTDLQNQIDDTNDYYFDLIERAKQYGLDTTALEKERTDKLAELQIESEQKVFDAKLQLAQASVGILQGLQGLVKQGSDAQKALALTEIAANTAIGFIQGLNVAQKAAAGTGPAAAYAFPIFYASQIGAVLAAAGKAKSILGKGGGGGSAPSIPSAGATAGAGGVPLNNISNTASLVDQQQQEITTQVVVLESDITTTQENVTAVSELSSF